MKKTFVLFLGLFVFGNVYASQITAFQARAAAYNFAKLMGCPFKSVADLSDVSCVDSFPGLFLFDIKDGKGFIVISSNNSTAPVLAYSFENGLDLNQNAVVSLLTTFSRFVLSYSDSSCYNNSFQWELLLDDTVGTLMTDKAHSVPQLLTTLWGANSPYNTACPWDSISNIRTHAGCEAVAMAQLLYYWKRPARGTGSCSYVDSVYGIQQAQFDTTSYAWSLMPNLLYYYSNSRQIQAVSQLIYHCGVSMQTQYNTIHSKASFTATDSNDHVSMQNALWRHFGFKQNLHPLYQDSLTAQQWADSIKSELDQGRPVLCMSSASDTSLRHTYLLDGYDALGRFHVNWGWSGISNGYYMLDLLPQNGYHQVMLAGVEPNGALRSNGSDYRFSFTGGCNYPIIFRDTTVATYWSATVDQSWVTLSPSSGSGEADTLIISVDTNYSFNTRNALVVVWQGGDSIHIRITQYGSTVSSDSSNWQDTLQMRCQTTQHQVADTLFPGKRYLIVNPGDSTSYPSPCNSWMDLHSQSGYIIIDSIVYDIKRDSDYLQIFDLDYPYLSPIYSITDSGQMHSLPVFSNNASVHFHSDCYLPRTGFRLYLHVCDTSVITGHNLVVIPISRDSCRLIWTDTLSGGPWYVFGGYSPYSLNYLTTVDSTMVELPYNTQSYPFFRVTSDSIDFLCDFISPSLNQCEYYNTIHGVSINEVKAHSARISWHDYSSSSRWYIHYHSDTEIRIDSTDEPTIVLDSLNNNSCYWVYLSNNREHEEEIMPCNQYYFCTPYCDVDSLSCRDISIDSITARTARITWSEYGNATRWNVVVNDNHGNYDTLECDTTVCPLIGLVPGRYYSIAVFNNTDHLLDDLCQQWIGFTTECVSFEPCIDYTNFQSCMVTTTYGWFDRPTYYWGIFDLGSADSRSRHTVYRDDDSLLTDPLTGGLLRIIPEGDTATVRLGNWLAGGEAESIIYAYDVDTSYYNLLMMKYAAVLENPNHDVSNQPRFTFRIKDERGQDINAGCYSADFVADSALGWNVNGHVLWKDWTSVGIDLTPLHGRRIFIQLTTYDCAEGSHFGYAYFNFKCSNKVLKAERCGNGENTLTAPLGFNYEWHDMATDTIVSTEQTITVDHAIDLYCRLSFLGANDDSCGFEMMASAAYRYPNALFGFELGDTIDCRQLISFSDSSFVSHGSNGEISTKMLCDSVKWFFGDGDSSTVRNPQHLYYWGEYDLMCISFIDSDLCSDTNRYHLVVMPTCPVYDTTEYYLCPGDTMGYYAITIMDTGMYTYVDGMFYHTAIVREGRSYATICDTIVENQLPYSYNGYIFDDSISHYTIILQGANIHHCDSVITYSLFVYANVHTNIDTTVCPYDVPMEWNGITISDNYFDSIVIATTHGADSIISLHLTVARNLKAHIGTNRTIVSYANYCDIVLYDNSAHSVHRTWILPDATDDGATFRYCYPLDYDSVEVLLVAESELGCRDTDVCYLYLEEPTLFAPNVFTPNLSTNNRFSLSGSRIATLSVDVFNRRGVLLYHWEGLDGGWDGTSGGVLLPQEAYVWHARYTTTVNPSEVQTRTGTVVLLR